MKDKAIRFSKTYAPKPHTMRPFNIGSIDSIAALRRHNMHTLAMEVKKASDKQKNLEARLSIDPSKTEVAANLVSAKQAKKGLNDLDESFLEMSKAASDIIAVMEARVAPMKEIRGSTDLLILQNYMPLIKKKSDIFRLAEIDQNAARLGLLPLIKHEYNLSKADFDRLHESLSKHVLGRDYAKLQTLKTEVETLETVRAGFYRDYETTLSEINHLSKNIVEIPEVA